MESTEKKLLLSISNASIGYRSGKKENCVAKGISVGIQPGNLVCLLGKNGIGKSTLLRSISKVQPLLSGSIFIKGKNILDYSPREFSKVMSLVLTEKLPESNLTVFELIALGRQPYTDWLGNMTQSDADIIEKALKATHTNHLTGQRINELSDGQLQKVLIARAIAQDTECIILDEPTAHLDIHHKIETFTLLKKLAKEFGKTILISTHEIQIALQLADELWLMNDNKFIANSPEYLIENNALDHLFSSDLIRFDKNLKQFIIK
ncbi:MAG: ABC transporter ATP-binding protein [Flavobacteriaceae bacterium]|nr:MAG: ABC transporter ATP-binding protein [Flavobacteriaceae bacterium]